MIGKFKDNIFILNKNIEIDDFFKNHFYEIKDNKITLLSPAFIFKDDKIITLEKGEYDLEEINKILFSDEINKDKFENNLIYNDDKFIYIHFFDIKYDKCKYFNTSFEDVKKAEKFLSDFIYERFGDVSKESVLLVFNELFFNAYEHGNLSLNFEEKEKLLENGKYMDFLKNAKSDKKIYLCVSKLEYKNGQYLIAKITDEGKGFNVKQKKTALYNGRGLLMSDRICDGVFYNQKGNSVIFIKEMK